MAFKWCSGGTAKKISPIPSNHHCQEELLIRDRMDPSFHVLLEPNSDPTMQKLHQKSSLIRPANVFPVFCCSILVLLYEGLPQFLVLSLQELELVWSYAAHLCRLCIQRCFSAYFSYNEWLFRVPVSFLSAQSSLAILLWPLASTRYFQPEHCHSLDVFWLFSVNPRDDGGQGLSNCQSTVFFFPHTNNKAIVN